MRRCLAAPSFSTASRLVLASALGLSACKGGDEQGESSEDGMTVVEGRRTTTPEFYAADAAYIQKNANFFFRIFNDTFARRLDTLPSVGEVPDAKKPHSGGYYAEGDGGTDQIVAGNRTVLQKYDQAFHGGENKASAWERSKHTTGPAWAGHCNGYAAAAQRHPQEPDRNVTRNGVTFTPKDVKALLAETHMNADYEFLGGNRCDAGGTPPPPGGRPDPTVMGACEDINPGTLHTTIANWIGRMKHTLVMDMFRGDEVWNYPLYAYKVLQNTAVTAAQAQQYITGGAGTYIFNPTATRFAYMKTRLTYADGYRQEVLETLTPKYMELVYILELNAAGEIVGGEWVGDSQRVHPDFLWVALEPLEPNGTRYMGNPHVANQEVLKLWAESIGADPNNPPLDIKRPESIDTWGKWPNLEVKLDGNARGAVFAGKSTTLRLKRLGSLTGDDLTVDLTLNGASVKTLDAGDVGEGKDLVYEFEPGLGLSRFLITFKRGGTVLEGHEYQARFYAVR